MKIYVVSGKARHGKDTVASFIREYYGSKGLKVINLSYGFYIKEYAKHISNWDGSDESKPRELLQELGTDIIRKTIDEDFFVKRIYEDILVYSHFFDVITISDARFLNEIIMPKEKFGACNIRVVRENYLSNLTKNEQKHLTETALDGYNSYDYVIENDGTLDELKEKVLSVVRSEDDEH